MDLAALQAMLAGLGPWGIAGMGVLLAVQWYRNRNSTPAPAPTPGPAPVPAPNPLPSGRPLLDALSAILPQLLNSLLAKRAGGGAGVQAVVDDDIGADEVAKIVRAVLDAAGK